MARHGRSATAGWVRAFGDLALTLTLTLTLTERMAGAEENKISLHLEAGPLFKISEPSNLVPNQKGALVGAHVGIGFEYSVHDRLGLELIYAPDQIFAAFGGQAILQQRVGLGIRLRPWFGSGFILPRTGDDPLPASKILSDVWIDLHGGIALSSETSVMVDAAVGTRFPVIWPIQIGVYARYQQLFPISGMLNGTWAQLSAGIELSAGFLSMHPEPDTDDDGVADSKDRCPGTAPGTEINDVGCPQSRVKTPPPRCSDTDLDGVCDGGDSCDATPLGTKVDKWGCPIEPEAEPGTEEPPAK